MEKAEYDVIVVGAGPVGLLLGYALERLGVSTIIIERLDKSNLPMYGRACTLYSRSLEMLDQLDLLDDFTQVGFVARNSVNYKDGKRVVARGWNNMFSQMGETFHNYCLNIRLKYSEDLIQAAYEKAGGTVAIGWELKSIDTEQANAVAVNIFKDKARIIRGKYLVGCDGGSSTVRQLSDISMPTDETTYTWIRIDGVVKTDMADAGLGFASIESSTHGNVLWCALDHGRNRVGYALSPALVREYGHRLSQEQAVLQAKKAFAPFSLEFEKVDWFTTYDIRQGVAERFIQGRVILAGDACHVHSSGAAQGMNTGIHDAVNLAWKLAGTIHGRYQPTVLDTYETERRAVALELIAMDRNFASLISGGGENPTEVNEAFTKALDNSVQFRIGLGVNYDENILNRPATSGCALVGWRAPDGLVFPPGPRIPRQIHKLLSSQDFTVVVFPGDTLLTSLPEKIDAHCVTMLSSWKPEGAVALGKSFGKFYFDLDNSLYARYGFSTETGGIAVIRPDGILGFACTLKETDELEKYFEGIRLKT